MGRSTSIDPEILRPSICVCDALNFTLGGKLAKVTDELQLAKYQIQNHYGNEQEVIGIQCWVGTLGCIFEFNHHA